jgi:hypothetical protein
VANAWTLANTTEDDAATNLRAARAEIDSLLATDEEFRNAIGASTVDVVLVDDYDTGYVAICRLSEGGELEWLTRRVGPNRSGDIPEL